MKIIITESQKEQLKQELTNLVNEVGFNEAADNLNLSKIKLAKITNLPIVGDTFHDYNEIVVGDLLGELVDRNEEYKNCTISYFRREDIIEWSCEWTDENDVVEYITNTYATPYWDNSRSTSIDLGSVRVFETQQYYDTVGEYLNDFDCPKEFNNVNELIEWFDNEYKPKVYELIKGQLERFKDAEGYL